MTGKRCANCRRRPCPSCHARGRDLELYVRGDVAGVLCRQCGVAGPAVGRGTLTKEQFRHTAHAAWNEMPRREKPAKRKRFASQVARFPLPGIDKDKSERIESEIVSSSEACLADLMENTEGPSQLGGVFFMLLAAAQNMGGADYVFRGLAACSEAVQQANLGVFFDPHTRTLRVVKIQETESATAALKLQIAQQFGITKGDA